MMADDLVRYRAQFPILKTTTYLISNSLGAMPQRAYDALHDYAEAWATRGVRAWQEKWWNLPRVMGNRIGELIHAPPDSVIWQPNVTLAHAQVLSCFDFTTRRKIVTDDMHFPSILYLLDRQRARGANIVTIHSDDGVTIDQQQLLDAVDEQTALVVVSHVQFKTAFVQDVAAITKRAHAVGAQVMFDGYQAVGTVPVDVTAIGADFYAGGNLKWLCGGPGISYLYVRPDLLPTLEPQLVGWYAHARPFDFTPPPLEYLPDIGRFAIGTPSIASLYAAQPGLDIVSEIDVENIRNKSIRQTARLIELADELAFPITTPRNPRERGGTIAVNIENGYAISKVLKDREFLVDYRPGAGIRISPHFYTTDDELDAVMLEIKKIRETRAHEKYLTEARDTVT